MEASNSDKIKELERLTTLKENIKAMFDSNKLNDIALQQAVENANKKRKETTKALTAEEEKKVKLEKSSVKNEQLILELEELEPKLVEERQIAQEKHEEIIKSLAQDTQSLQVFKKKIFFSFLLHNNKSLKISFLIYLGRKRITSIGVSRVKKGC